jgi:hypothetical protein
MVLRLRETSPDNWTNAKCLSVTVTQDYDPFFSEEEEDIQEAVSYCNGEADGIVCPIREQCLLFALTNNEKYGVWGGSDEITRRATRKKWPSRSGRPNKEWKWLSKEDALKGLRKEELLLMEDEE